MLDKDRVDVIISPRVVGLFQLNKLALTNIHAIDPPIVRLNQYHYLHKRHAILAPRLETVLKEMKESGEIEAIRSRFVKELKQSIIRTDS